MSDRWTLVLTMLMTLGSGLVAGVFLAFSTFVMTAINHQAPGQAIRVMQSINRTVVNPVFMGLLFGTALLCLVLAVVAFRGRGEPGSTLVLAACLVYLIATIGVTVTGNVPLNDRLDAGSPDASDAARQWADFYARWLRWNHVRTVAAGVAAALGLVAIARQARSVDLPF